MPLFDYKAVVHRGAVKCNGLKFRYSHCLVLLFLEYHKNDTNFKNFVENLWTH